MAPPRRSRPAAENPPAPPVLEPIQPSPELVPSPPRETSTPSAASRRPARRGGGGRSPLGEGTPPSLVFAPVMTVPPPMLLGGGLAPFPPHYGYPAFAAAGPPQLALTPDTIFQGTVTIGNIKSDGTPSRSYGFIKVDHTHNEVFWSEADVLDGYLSKGDRCEFRIVDAKSPNRRTGLRQWKATDVVCIQRSDASVRRVVAKLPTASAAPAVASTAPPGDSRQSVSRDTVEAEVRALVAEQRAHGPRRPGEICVAQLSGRYRRTYGRILDYKSLGFAKMTAFVAAIPGLELMDGPAGGTVRVAPAPAQMYDDETAPREPGVSEAMRQLSLEPRVTPAAALEGKGGEDGYCVTLHNLSYDTKRYDLKEHVKTILDGGFGRVELQTKGLTGMSMGRARVRFRFLKDANAAAKALDGTELDGRTLSARVAKPRPERPAGKGAPTPAPSAATPAPTPDETARREPGVSEAMRHLSLEPKRDESKTEPVPAGYTVVAAVLQHLDETRLLPTFLAQQIDDAAVPYLEPTDLIELGVAPMTCLAILGASAAGGKAKKLETQDVLHDVATHQSVLEAELREHRREIARLRISREEVSEDLCCSITCELMKDPVVCVGDGHTYERVAVEQWFATGARTSPTTNERLDNLTLIPNHTVRRLILALLERRRDASGADETKGPS